MATTYLTRTPSSTGNRILWTWSAWIKKAIPDGSDVGVFGVYQDGNNYFRIRYRSDQRLQVDNYNSGSPTMSIILGVEHRDPSGWYHLVIAYDSAQGTASNRVKIYVNNVLQTVFQAATYPSVNVITELPSSGLPIELGRTTNSQYFDGCMNNVAFVDGTALTPSNFGETDSASGIWKFKTPSGVTWGTNGFHLKMDNSANLGLDSSGETNNFTLSGNGRQAKDTPTNVYATLNPLVNGDGSYSLTNGNNKFTGAGGNDHIFGTLGAIGGKFYYETKWVTRPEASYAGFAPAEEAQTLGTTEPGNTVLAGLYRDDYFINVGNVNEGAYTDVSAGDIFGFAIDLSSSSGSRTLKVYKNGTLVHTMTLATTYENDVWLPCVGDTSSTDGVMECNFGNGYFGTTAITSAGSNGNGSLFEYDVPSGYYALNTKNLNTYG